MQTLKQVVKELNSHDLDADLFFSALSAKRAAKKLYNPCIVKFTNGGNWQNFTRGLVKLYTWLPAGYPISKLAKQLYCSANDLEIISRWVIDKWVNI